MNEFKQTLGLNMLLNTMRKLIHTGKPLFQVAQHETRTTVVNQDLLNGNRQEYHFRILLQIRVAVEGLSVQGYRHLRVQ